MSEDGLEDHENEHEEEDANDEVENEQNDTLDRGNGAEDTSDILRILLSTDSHLGYCEKDPIRGLDSFAAFEEVLRMGRSRKVDMVLFAGDLFHDNKPSRNTMHKAMEIVRRYCMGPNPVRFQVVSDKSVNFRNITGMANYEDQFYSVDLPIFSIHGNHDDPTRDGSTDMLAALDLLSVSNLVNYFGRQDEVDKVTVSPVLIRKGNTKIALYGMGSMRDERLNRMWQNKKVRFLRPTPASGRSENDDDGIPWFNIFALHQNRDLGRGSKNCVHESMIPEWMDLVIWGHEHECQIEPTESLVGTYRITQPGSSVATSLTNGESVRKRVGILEIRMNQFRLSPIPLSQVRAFALKEISLADEDQLDPDDAKIDERVNDVLGHHVDQLVVEAREKSKELIEDAEESRQSHPSEYDGVPEQKYTIKNPHEVLVRLKVEHTGYTALNNQRFGAKFVGQIANPSDILLFHRRRKDKDKEGSSDGKKGKSKSSVLDAPIAPEELVEISVEDLVKETLVESEKKLEFLDEGGVSLALEDFVIKEERAAINEEVEKQLFKQQKKLIKRGVIGEEDNKVTTQAGVKEVCRAEAEKVRALAVEEDEEKQSQMKKHQRKRQAILNDGEDEDFDMKNGGNGYRDDTEDDDTGRITKQKKRSAPLTDDEGATTSRKRGKASAAFSDDEEPTTTTKKLGRSFAASNNVGKSSAVDLSSDGSPQEVQPSKERRTAVSSRRPTRKAALSRKANRYADDGDDDDVDFSVGSEEMAGSEHLGDDENVDSEEETPPKKRSTGKARNGGSVQPKVKKAAKSNASNRRTGPGRTTKRSTNYDEESDDDNGRDRMRTLAANWGTAASSQSQSRLKRARR